MVKRKYASILAPALVLLIITGCGTSSTSTSNSGYGTSANTSSQSATTSNATTSNATASNITTSNTTASNTTASNTTTSSTISSNPAWVQIDEAAKTVTYDIVAAQSGNNNGFNFNGYSAGALTITIPVDWHVKVKFTNDSSSIPHSVEVVPYSQRAAANNFTTAFTGAASANPSAGITSGTEQSFSFTANQTGKYALVCAVPGHAEIGLWDNFVVSSNATTPSVSTSVASSNSSVSNTSSSSSGNGW